jgi:DNA-directed RNA polymerase subunit E'/Rpb7
MQQQKEFSDAQRKRVAARWKKQHAAAQGEPIRQTRVVELVIRDSQRTMRNIKLTAHQRERGWSRWTVTENNTPIGRRAFGAHAIAQLIARSL